MSESRPPEVERAYDHLDDVETQVPAGLPQSPERLETLRESLEAYESSEAEGEQRELLDRIDAEIDELRDAIEREVDEGAEAAHDALAAFEERFADLRKRLHS
jgi:predicted  nucleic acid-binding Zn-ribbon protein